MEGYVELTGQPEYLRLWIQRKNPISQRKMESNREHLTLTSGLHVYRCAQVTVHVHTHRDRQRQRDRESDRRPSLQVSDTPHHWFLAIHATENFAMVTAVLKRNSTKPLDASL